ncbi:MAG: hypothetical protein ACHQUC_10510 [Chlamydiales bacterium]
MQVAALHSTNLQTDGAYKGCGGQWLHSSLSRFSRITFKQLEHIWSYVGKIVLISRNLLNAAARSPCILSLVSENFPHKIKNITTRMKLFSIVSVPFSLADINATSQKILKSFSMDDKEGVALGLLSLAIIAADAFDSLTTFINAALTIAGIDPIKLISSIDLPVAFAIAGMGTLSRTIQIAKTYSLYRKINSEILQKPDGENRTILKKFLKRTLGVDQVKKLTKSIELSQINQTTGANIEKFKEKMKAAILRAAPNEAVLELERLLDTLKSSKIEPCTNEETKNRIDSLNKIQELLRKKMRVDALGIFANVTVLSALRLFYIGIATTLPFLLLASAFSVRIVSLVYQDLNK